MWVSTNAPAALLTPPDEHFLLSAKVTVNFASTFDAGCSCYERENLWTKLCFEYSPQNQPMIVSVVTRGLSDDCNSTVIDETLSTARGRDGRGFWVSITRLMATYWNMVRTFTLGKVENLRVASRHSRHRRGLHCRFFGDHLSA